MLVRRLGAARLLTMEGDSHTSFGQSACIAAAVERYLIDRVLPAEGTMCPHDVPFAPPAPEELPTAAGVHRPDPLARLAPGLRR
jgi:TAP-like protein